MIRSRCGILKLKVNDGGWMGIELSQRLCQLSNDGTEEEDHFILVCKHYKNLRQRYLSCMHTTM